MKNTYNDAQPDPEGKLLKFTSAIESLYSE